MTGCSTKLEIRIQLRRKMSGREQVWLISMGVASLGQSL